MENSVSKGSAVKDVLVGALAAIVLVAVVVGIWQLANSKEQDSALATTASATTAIDIDVNQVVDEEPTSQAVATSSVSVAPEPVFNIDRIHELEEEISSGTIDAERQITILEQELIAINLDPTVAGTAGMRDIIIPLIEALKVVESDPTETTRVKDLAYQLHGLGHESGHSH